VVELVADAVENGRRLIMANANLHGLSTMYQSPAMAALLTQPDTLVMIDSMPILFLATLTGKPMPRAKRSTSLDFYDLLFKVGSAHGWKFGFLGGTQDVVDRGLDVLRGRFPDIQIDGRSGYFDMNDRSPGSAYDNVLKWAAAGSHDVLIVGMGMPRQEEWIHDVQHRVGTRVFLPAGAYLDYQVGAQKAAPRWLGQIGFEWAYRLLRAPWRLSYRYLIEPLLLLRRLIMDRHPQESYRQSRLQAREP
jgi:N-acetylglucosaminyldiphosphoundecaprenol N-acetyl-beta-D-mannosaminyltransferase